MTLNMGDRIDLIYEKLDAGYCKYRKNGNICDFNDRDPKPCDSFLCPAMNSIRGILVHYIHK